MRHELTRDIDVDNLHIEIGRELYHTSAYSVEPTISDEVIVCGGKDEAVEDVGHRYESPHHDDR